MIGFPYNYSDNLTQIEAQKNRQLFLKKYGSTILVNSVLFAFTKQVKADDKTLVPEIPQKAIEGTKPAPAPVFAPVFPPSALIESRIWTYGGVASVAWICLTAAATGEPTLLIACTSLLTYAIGKK